MATMASPLLKVPYYQQNQIDSALNSYWQNRSCGLLALKMVIDYYRQRVGKSPTDLADIFQKAMANGGVNEAGDWQHAALVKTAQQYGYIAWRRSWQPARRDIEWFKSEGLKAESLERWQDQANAEALPSLVDSLERFCPVLVSVAKNFDEINRPHFVVLIGVRQSSGKLAGFYFNDPYSPTTRSRRGHYVSLAIFTNKWNWRGIFVQPKKVKR